MSESNPSGWRSLVGLPFLPLILTPFILLAPVLLTGRALFWGTPALQFVPWWAWAWDALRAGHLPLWNPLVGMGAPLLANYQSALFYPPTWIYFGLAAMGGVQAIAWGQALMVALHLAWAGIGMSILVSRLGLKPLSQTIAGLAFGLSGYLVARSGFLSINAAAAWLPWVLIGARETALSSGWWKPARALAIPFGFQLLAGHAQTATYTLVIASVWMAFWGWRREIGGDVSVSSKMSSLASAAGRFGLGASAAFGLAAIQLLPTIEYLSQSQRATAVEYDIAMTYSFWPWRFLTVLAPDLFGNPAMGDYWGYGNYWEDAIYVGLLPFILAAMAGIRALRHPGRKIPQDPASLNRSTELRSLTGLLFLVMVVTFALALGKNTPIFPWLYNHIPGFDMFQAPTRFTLLAVFALALLAAIGAEAWLRPVSRGLYWTRLATAGAVAVALGAGLARYYIGDLAPTFFRAVALAGFWGLAVGALTLLAPSGTQPDELPVWRWGATFVLAADVLVAGWGLNPGVELEFYRDAPSTVRDVRELGGGARIYLPADQEYRLKFERFLRFDTFNPGEEWSVLRAAMLPNLQMLDGLAHVSNFDPLVPGRYARWMAHLDQLHPDGRVDLLNLMGVGVVERTEIRQPLGFVFDQFAGSRRIHWYSCARPASNGDDAWYQVINSHIDLDNEVVLEGISPEQVLGCSQGGHAEIQVLDEQPQRLSFAVRAEDTGWLFLGDVWYPDWEVWVDGKQTELLKADYLFRAVEVPAGEHQVVMVYRPRSFYLGALISMLAWVGIGAGVARRLIWQH